MIQKRECAKKKLFGKCRNGKCTYRHGGVKPVERYISADIAIWCACLYQTSTHKLWRFLHIT